jgi:hypothetical protein
MDNVPNKIDFGDKVFGNSESTPSVLKFFSAFYGNQVQRGTVDGLVDESTFIVNLERSGQVAVPDIDLVTVTGKEMSSVTRKKRKLFASPQKPVSTPKKNISLLIDESAIKGKFSPQQQIHIKILFSNRRFFTRKQQQTTCACLH